MILKPQSGSKQVVGILSGGSVTVPPAATGGVDSGNNPPGKNSMVLVVAGAFPLPWFLMEITSLPCLSLSQNPCWSGLLSRLMGIKSGPTMDRVCRQPLEATVIKRPNIPSTSNRRYMAYLLPPLPRTRQSLTKRSWGSKHIPIPRHTW